MTAFKIIKYLFPSLFSAFLAIFSCATLSYANILVIAPHPDDDILVASGITEHALQRGETVVIVYITNGDYRGTLEGLTRQTEAVNAQVNRLGMIEDNLVFLGYPDGYLATVYTNYTGMNDRFATPSGQSETYGNRGLGRKDYHSYRFGSPAYYNRHNILSDLQDIISTFTPDHIFTTSEFDVHYDHLTTYKLLKLALLEVFNNLPNYTPQVHSTIIHSGGTGGTWPAPMDATSYFTEVPNLSQTGLAWANRERIDVPLSMQSIDYALNPKFKATLDHKSQSSTYGFLTSFLHKDEFFWIENFRGNNRPPIVSAGHDTTIGEGAVINLDGSGSFDPDGSSLSFLWTQTAGIHVPLSDVAAAMPTLTSPVGLAHDEVLTFQLVVGDGEFSSIPDTVTIKVHAENPTYYNIAPLAAVTASSEYVSRGSLAIKAVDGVVDGFPPPGDYTREWMTVGQKTGAWIRLNWSESYVVDRIIFYDRPNTNDQIVSANLTFSDGSSFTVGPLSNEGYGVEYSFAPRTITSMMLTVTGVSSTTSSVGLAEIKIYGTPAQAGNRRPAANAGVDQSVMEGAVVHLDGSVSSDPDGDPLTFQWTQTAGIPVQLSSPTSTNPAFTAPTGLTGDEVLTFQLIVNDGQLSSMPDFINISVQASNHSPIANAGVDQSVMEGAVVYLDGSGSSDPDGDPLTFQWVQTTGIAVQLSSSTIADPVFTAPTGLIGDEVLTFQLIVNDGQLNSAPDFSNISVQASSHAPAANAGVDQTAMEGAVVYLDGSGSLDPDGDPLTFQWVQTAGIPVQLSSSTIANPAFTAPTGLTGDEVLTFQLVTSDGGMNSVPDSVNITVRSAEGGAGSCPDGAFLSYWNGDYLSGASNICSNNGLSIKEGIQNGTVEIGFSYGQNGTVGVQINSINESLGWAISGHDLLNEETGTMWFSIFFPNLSRVGATHFIEANSGNSANLLYALSIVNGRVICGYKGASSGAVEVISAARNKISTQTWTRVGCSWDRPNNKLSVKVDNGPWTELVHSLVQWTSPVSELHIGEESSQNSVRDPYYLDNMLVSGEYQASDPGL